MKYLFVEEHRSEFAVAKMANVLDISTSGYYTWRVEPVGKRENENLVLADKITKIFVDSKSRYGSPRITEELKKGNVQCSRKRVAKIMRYEGLRAKAARKFKATTDSDHSYDASPNLLGQNFTSSKPNEIWLSDLTYVSTGEGWLYLCVILDLCSKKIVGWSMSKRLKADLAINALKMAYNNRKPPPGLIFHSDRGVQYSCKEFRRMLNGMGLIQSMSGKGNCYDNAPVESFFHTLKTEEIHWNYYATRESSKRCIFEYIEIFYNRKRMHSSLGYLSPAEFEEKIERGYFKKAA